jgi:hypothetical protein
MANLDHELISWIVLNYQCLTNKLINTHYRVTPTSQRQTRIPLQGADPGRAFTPNTAKGRRGPDGFISPRIDGWSTPPHDGKFGACSLYP